MNVKFTTKIKLPQNFNVMKDHFKNLLTDAFKKLRHMYDRIELQDVDGISTGIGHPSANINVARQSSLRDLKQTSEQRYNIEGQQHHTDIEYYSSKIKKEGGTQNDIDECRKKS